MTRLRSNDTLHPITEDDIAQFLVHTPDFFVRHAQILSAIQLGSPHGNRAVSLQERQAQMLREKIKALEHRIMDMVRHGNENVITTNRLHDWACDLLQTRALRDLPRRMEQEIQDRFRVAQASLRVWDVDATYANEAFAKGVSADARSFASSLTQPFCGANAGFEAVQWLADPAAAASVALLPLRIGKHGNGYVAPSPLIGSTKHIPAFGLLVLASPDAERFHAGMGTEFLESMAELASAVLSRLGHPN